MARDSDGREVIPRASEEDGSKAACVAEGCSEEAHQKEVGSLGRAAGQTACPAAAAVRASHPTNQSWIRSTHRFFVRCTQAKGCRFLAGPGTKHASLTRLCVA